MSTLASCTGGLTALSCLAWSWVGGRLALFYIHQTNRVNSRNGCAMMTAPQTLSLNYYYYFFIPSVSIIIIIIIIIIIFFFNYYYYCYYLNPG